MPVYTDMDSVPRDKCAEGVIRIDSSITERKEYAFFTEVTDAKYKGNIIKWNELHLTPTALD